LVQDTQINVTLQDTGFWHIDKETGKWMCILTLRGNGYELNHVPTHDFCLEYLDKMLDAEWRNDERVFANGERRPPQLRMKIWKLQLTLDKWKKKAK
jgi:hypothetical protein